MASRPRLFYRNGERTFHDRRGGLWSVSYEDRRGLALLHKGRRASTTDGPKSWALVAPNGNGEWLRLVAGQSPVVPAQPFPYPRQPWEPCGRPRRVSYQHPTRDTPEAGIRHEVSFRGGGTIRFYLPSLTRRDAYNPRLEKMPTLEELAGGYSRIPPRVMPRIVNRVYVHHLTEPDGTLAWFHRQEAARVDHFPPFANDGERLETVIIHEAFGHGIALKTLVFESLWRGAMILDGEPSSDLHANLQEDWSCRMESYFLGERRRHEHHRLAVIDFLLRAGRLPLTDRAVASAFRLFQVQAERPVMGGLAAT